MARFDTTFDASGVVSTTLSYPAATDGTAVSVTLSNESLAATNSRQCCPNGTSCTVSNSCSSTFNTAGLKCAQLVVPSPADRAAAACCSRRRRWTARAAAWASRAA